MESNGVAHLRTTCSWVMERQTGAHQKVQKEERMERRWNAVLKKKKVSLGSKFTIPWAKMSESHVTVLGSDPDSSFLLMKIKLGNNDGSINWDPATQLEPDCGQYI